MASALLLALAALAPQQDARPARETVRYKELDQIVQAIAAEAEREDKAIVLWVVDNASSLKAQGGALADAIRKSFRKPGVRHAVAVLAETPRLHLKLTEGAEAAAKAVEALAAGPPDDAIKNCLLAVREAAKLAASVSARSPKLVILFTQDNADGEDDVEATVRLLKGSKVAFFGIVPEAVYSDPYWASAISGTSYYFSVEKFKKLSFELKGPESAFVEFPYGWPFTPIDPGYTVPSGFGPYAVGRLAAETGGKVYLHNPRRAELSFCQRHICLFCHGRHQACGANFNEAKLDLTAPALGSRAEYGTRYGREPLCLEIAAAWDRLHREGVLRGVPPCAPRGGNWSRTARSPRPPCTSRSPKGARAGRPRSRRRPRRGRRRTPWPPRPSGTGRTRTPA